MPTGPFRRRPWPIVVASLLIVLVASFHLWMQLRHVPTLRGVRIEQFPQIAWTDDLAIVSAFTEYTIALIPVVLILVFAKGFARMLVTVFSIGKALLAGMTVWEYHDHVGRVFTALLWEPALLLFAVCLLYLPSASQWLGERRTDETRVFD